MIKKSTLKYLPNILTISRVITIPVIVASFYFEDKKFAHIAAAFLFFIASATDFFDGWLARKYKIQSKFGMIFDPIADKVLIGCVILLIARFEKADLIPCLLIIAREFTISGLREFLAKKTLSIPVSSLGKIKTGLQMISLLIIILGTKGSGIEGVDELGNALLWITSILTVYTGYEYINGSLKYLR